jgi:hypothetical protein
MGELIDLDEARRRRASSSGPSNRPPRPEVSVKVDWASAATASLTIEISMSALAK